MLDSVHPEDGAPTRLTKLIATQDIKAGEEIAVLQGRRTQLDGKEWWASEVEILPSAKAHQEKDSFKRM